METKLSKEQEILLKNTRDTLGDARDLLASSNLSKLDRDALAESIRQLDELFLLVIAGEFNAGKSSFINALLGQTGLLQEGVTPTTSQVYLLKHGDDVSQSPREKGVWVQTAPIEMLQTINIVDTPGTNAINREHEALTSDFIPRSDLVLFLTSADRPFSESERAFLERIKGWGKKIVIVINKIDIFENQAELDKVVEFVRSSSQKLVGEIGGVYPVSSKLAQKAKSGKPEHWEASGFAPLERYIENTLDNSGRFRLKLLNPLGVGRRLVNQQLAQVDADWTLLEDDRQLLGDIEGQMQFYDEDMERNFEARLSEINNTLYEMEKRGDTFFDDTIRIGRVTDLIRRDYIREEFERIVVADTPKQLEQRIGELIDWMVEQDLRQWTAVADHLSRRKQQDDARIVGANTAQEGTLAYDRQRLVDSIGKSTNRTISSYDRAQEASRIADTAREAVAGLAAGGVGVSLGAVLLIWASAAWVDWTGAITGVGAILLGAFVFPNRRRKAKQLLNEKLNEMRIELLDTLRAQFEREMRRGRQRIDDTVAPFSRFVRAERDKIEGLRDGLIEMEAHIDGLTQQVEAV